MPLEIIGAGFGRTGTLSLLTALNQLGYPCYHMLEVLQNKANKSHLAWWRRVANAPAGVQQDWETVFARYSAAVDFPAACVWRELMSAYPLAKVILTLHPRGPEGWYESTIDTIYAPEHMWQAKVLEYTTPFGRNMSDMTRKLIWERTLRGTMDNRAKAIARYNEHVAEVKAAVPVERLLVFTVDQAWEPLCRFLGAGVPASPFPDVNDRAEIKRTIAGITNGAYVILVIGALFLAAAAYGAWRVLA